MFALQERSSAAGVEHHKKIPVRVYETDGCQADRIRRSRELLTKCPGTSIVELGCGTADISGPQSSPPYGKMVIGIDVCQPALNEAKRRFPNIITVCSPIPQECSFKGDILVLCETLEHLENPLDLCINWLPWFSNVIISHPLNEPMGCGLSAGEHQWSYDEADFERWFRVGKHTMLEKQIFKMGDYTVILGLGMRVR